MEIIDFTERDTGLIIAIGNPCGKQATRVRSDFGKGCYQIALGNRSERRITVRIYNKMGFDRFAISVYLKLSE